MNVRREIRNAMRGTFTCGTRRTAFFPVYVTTVCTVSATAAFPATHAERQIWMGLKARKSPTCYTSSHNRYFCTIHVLGTLLRYLHSTSVPWHACPIAHSGQSAAGEFRLDPLMARLAAGRARRSRASARSSPYVDEGRPPGRSRPAPCRRTTSPAAQLLLAPSGAASLMVCDDAWPKARTRRMG